MEKMPHTQAARKRRELLEDALLELMRTKCYIQTSVTDICRVAGIPRRTFYHYFECKEAVLHAVVERMMNECSLAVMLDFDGSMEKMRESMVRNFRYWQQEGREKMDLLLRNGLSAEMTQCALRWLETERIVGLHQDSKRAEINAMIGISGFFTLLIYWRKNEYRDTPEEMAEYAIRFLLEPLYQI